MNYAPNHPLLRSDPADGYIAYVGRILIIHKLGMEEACPVTSSITFSSVAPHPVRVHASPHGLLLLDDLKFLSKIVNSFAATSIGNVILGGFRGLKIKIAN